MESYIYAFVAAISFLGAKLSARLLKEDSNALYYIGRKSCMQKAGKGNSRAQPNYSVGIP